MALSEKYKKAFERGQPFARKRVNLAKGRPRPGSASSKRARIVIMAGAPFPPHPDPLTHFTLQCRISRRLRYHRQINGKLMLTLEDEIGALEELESSLPFRAHA